MRIRTQLILASFFLAVLPLGAIVTYSYHSSRRALESAERREADRMRQQMDRRLASIRADLDQRITFVSALPVTDAGSSEIGSSIATAMGDVSSLVEALEFKPLQIAGAATTPKTEEPAEPADPPPPAPTQMVVHAPHPPGVPLVLDLPDMPVIPQYQMSEEQHELIEEVGRLGGQLGSPSLTDEERQDISAEMEAVQKKLNEVVGQDMRRYRAEMAAARRASHDRQRALRQEQRAAARTGQTGVNATPAAAPEPVVRVAPAEFRGTTAAEIAKSLVVEKKTSLILGKKFNAPVRREGEVIGQIAPRINPEQVIRRVLGRTTQDGDEIPFAIDREGTMYTRTPEERAMLDRLGVLPRVLRGASLHGIPGWIVSSSIDEQSGLRIGVARPVGDTLDDLRRAAGRNFVLGLGLIAFALIGIVPLSNHLTRDVKLVTDGAERIAHGDLMTRLPVKTKNELGQLARAFNRMAEDLSHQQQKLLEQERAQKEQDIQQRLLAVEYERKTVELEDARRFQLSMLPKEVPRHERYDIAVFTRTATEVGGDYYDFHAGADGVLSVTIGDAIGHGAKAGTMVTVIKTLFSGYSGDDSPAAFLRDAAEKIKRMELGRMSMALSLARLAGHTITLASAGMPPVLVHRAASGAVEEIAQSATPLGAFGSDYHEVSADLASGDTVLFLSDGFPELMNDAGQQVGYAATVDAFTAAARAENADGVIAALAATARRWHGEAPPNDDVTFVVVRVV